MNLSQSSRLLVFVSKSCLPVCLKAHVCLCLFQSSCLLVCFKVHVYMCLSQNSCLPIVCFKALVYLCLHQSSCLPMYVSKLLSTTIYLHEILKVYEFWSSSQAWLTLPYNICMQWIFKLLKVHLLCATVCLYEIWKLSEFLSSSHVTLYCLPQIMHKYFKVLSFKAPQSSSFIC